MENQNNILGMLELVLRPAFCVSDGQVIHVNRRAQNLGIAVGTPICEMLKTGAQQYADLKDNCLYLTVCVQKNHFGASVSHMDGFDVFILEPEEIQPELQALALAARELREPLSNLMIAADRLLPTLDTEDETAQRQAANINRSLHHMFRLIGNMSDGARYTEDRISRKEYQNICALMEEYFQKAAALVENAGVTLEFTNHPDPIRSTVDTEKLERAVYNLISNAVKFTPKGGRIEAKLFRRDNTAYLTIADSGSGIPKDQLSSLYFRYLRPSCVEDSRHGIGLGMVLVQAAATAHGGTVLIEQPQEGGTRVTFTMEIRQKTDGNFSSPSGLSIDYTGGRDRGLIELSDLLPSASFRSKEIN